MLNGFGLVTKNIPIEILILRCVGFFMEHAAKRNHGACYEINSHKKRKSVNLLVKWCLKREVLFLNLIKRF